MSMRKRAVSLMVLLLCPIAIQERAKTKFKKKIKLKNFSFKK